MKLNQNHKKCYKPAERLTEKQLAHKEKRRKE
jgi:hypothetical protein